jgi:hypothetical protein
VGEVPDPIDGDGGASLLPLPFSLAAANEAIAWVGIYVCVVVAMVLVINPVKDR